MTLPSLLIEGERTHDVRLKKCFKCGETKPLDEFYRHKMMTDGHLGKCKECTKADVHANYINNPDKRREYESTRRKTDSRKAKRLVYAKTSMARYPERAKARQASNNATRDGKLIPMPCAVCGDPMVQGHHEDYSKPLEVTWLCFKHHCEAHGKSSSVRSHVAMHNANEPRQATP
jgi:hypothetical protein